jgi:hypothetical protein
MGVCSGYSNLMKEMCTDAGIQAQVVTGSLKNAAYGWTGTVPSGGHAWNAVWVYGKWNLVDCTLDAGSIDGDYFIKHYSTAYLFLPSRDFLYTHFPDNAALQFFAPEISSNTFEAEVAAPGAFFQYGLSLIDDMPLGNNNAYNKVFGFTMNQAAQDTLVSITADNNANAWVTLGEGVFNVGVELPDTSTAGIAYNVTITARGSTEQVIPLSIPADTFEGWWKKPSSDKSPLRTLLNNKQITRNEYVTFMKAWTKVKANNKYYFNEDQFAVQRDETIAKILKLLGQPLDGGGAELKFIVTDNDPTNA